MTDNFDLSRRTFLGASGALLSTSLLRATEPASAHSRFHGEFANPRVYELKRVWEKGYRGRPDRAVGVADTGADARHPDLAPWNGIRVESDMDGEPVLKRVEGDGNSTVVETATEDGSIGPGAVDAGQAQYARHEFEPPENADALSGTLSWTANTQDLDFYLEDPDGATVASSANFGGPEFVSAPASKTGAYTFVVETYASVYAEYTIEIAATKGGFQQRDVEDFSMPSNGDLVTAETPKMVGWKGGTFPRDGDGHGTHTSSISAGSGRGSTVDESSVVERAPRAVLVPTDVVSYEIDAAENGGVFIAAYGTGIELAIEDPDGRTVETATAAGDSSASGDITVAEAYAPDAGTYTAYVRPAEDGTARLERVATGAFLPPSETAGDRTGDEPTVHGGVAPNAALVNFEGFGAGLAEIAANGSFYRETFNLRTCNFSSGGLPTERAGVGSTYEQVQQATDNGLLVVSSAGNNGPLTGATGPSGADEAIACAATGPMDGLTAYTSGGTVTRSHEEADGDGATNENGVDTPAGEITRKPDVTAPGGTIDDSVNAAQAGDPKSDDPVRGYVAFAGTSMAAPYTNGTSGLVAQAMEDDAPQEFALPAPVDTKYEDIMRLKQVVLATASETPFIAAPYHRAHAPTYEFGGRDQFEGFGRVNPDAAVDAVSCELSGTTSESVGFDRHADARAVAGYVVGTGTFEASIAFSHLSGGNKSMTKGDPHLDLFVYDAANPLANGQPNVVAKAQGRQGDASVSFTTPKEGGAYFVVAKLVNVPGVVNGYDVQVNFDLAVEQVGDVIASGTRTDDGSVFTGGQTDAIDISVEASDDMLVRDTAPTEWTVDEEFSEHDHVHRDEKRGIQYVVLTPHGKPTASLDKGYYAEAPSGPEATGDYEFGPVEVSTDGGENWTAVAGTSDRNVVVGQET